VQNPFYRPQQSMVKAHHPQQLIQLWVFLLKFIEKIYTALQRNQGQLDLVKLIFIQEGAFYTGFVQVRKNVEEVRSGEGLTRKDNPPEFVCLIEKPVDQAGVLAKGDLGHKIRP